MTGGPKFQINKINLNRIRFGSELRSTRGRERSRLHRKLAVAENFAVDGTWDVSSCLTDFYRQLAFVLHRNKTIRRMGSRPRTLS